MIGSEYKIKLGDRYNYIDILLYNIEYDCYVFLSEKFVKNIDWTIKKIYT